MFEKTLNKISYNTWDEAFRGLIPRVRQESVRIAEYTQVLYLHAVKNDFYADNEKWQYRMQPQYGELAFKCGLYHQYGKALLPQELQLWNSNMTAQQEEEYKKYPEGGATLVEHLHKKTTKSKRTWGKQQEQEEKIDNIPLLMIMESCSMHNEKFDGSGYPAGLSGYDVSPIAYIVGFAKEFDNLVCSIKSETPFEEAFAAITAEKTAFPPELYDYLKKLKPKFKEIYKKYIQYTQTLPATIPLVDKREDRPMGLSLSVMEDCNTQSPLYCMAKPWFSPKIMKAEEDLPTNNLYSVFKRTGILADLTNYFLYEACDVVMRMENCRLAAKGVILEIIPDFYTLSYKGDMFIQLFKDQPIDKSHLLITVPENIVINSTKTVKDNIKKYIKDGLELVLTGYNPDRFPIEKLKEFGFKYVMPDSEGYGTEYLAKEISRLAANGIQAFAVNVDNDDKIDWIKNNKFVCYGGPVTGTVLTEDAFIQKCLLSESKMV